MDGAQPIKIGLELWWCGAVASTWKQVHRKSQHNNDTKLDIDTKLEIISYAWTLTHMVQLTHHCCCLGSIQGCSHPNRGSFNDETFRVVRANLSDGFRSSLSTLALSTPLSSFTAGDGGDDPSSFEALRRLKSSLP